MPNALPGLRGTTIQALYPVTRIVCCYTGISVFSNASEQRWVEQPPLYKFILPMQNLTATDKANYLTWFNAVKGQFATDVTLTLGSNTWSNLGLMSDSLEFTGTMPGRFDQNIQLRSIQSAASDYTPPTLGSSYPTFSWGSVAQSPVVQTSSYMTSVNEQASGPRYGYSWFGQSLPNFPTTYLRSWKITYTTLSDTDLATLENFFLASQGRYGSFSFQDPVDGQTYDHVRMGQDELPIKYLMPNVSMTSVTLVQTNGS